MTSSSDMLCREFEDVRIIDDMRSKGPDDALEAIHIDQLELSPLDVKAASPQRGS